MRLGKAYVSYYVMPVYVEPALLEGISPESKRRMQDKSCFNLTTIDEPLIAELADFTRRGCERTAGDASWGAARREQPPASRRYMNVEGAI